MIECGSLEYAHARLHARHGERADEAAWRSIESARGLAALLDAARSTALRPWLVGVDAHSSAHSIEAALRSHWRALVDEVAAWLPVEWQPALAWCAVLPDLPLLQHLARGGEGMEWMHDDPLWRDLCAAPPDARAALLRAGAYGALAAAWTAPQRLGQAWRDEWLRRVPQAGWGGDDASAQAGGSSRSALRVEPFGRLDGLMQLVRLLDEHAARFTEASAGQGWLQRAALKARLSSLLRRCVLEPAAAFVHVTLSALELERLRAELLRRVLFADTGLGAPRAKAA